MTPARASGDPVPAPALPARLRRLLLASGLGAALGPLAPQAGHGASAVAAKGVPLVTRTLHFPRDLGSHPEHNIEWWYITGHCTAGSGAQARLIGFQLTFFRARVDITQGMQSRLAAKQLLFAHAAVSDIQGKRFWHDQRIARQGLATASEQDAALRLRDWSLERHDGVYEARIQAADFALNLSFTETQPLILQGAAGLSRKGPDAAQASYYYSKPQLAFRGSIDLQGRRIDVAGDGARSAKQSFAGPPQERLHPLGGPGEARAGGNVSQFTPGTGAAWLDHEWSDGLMHPDAVGWDWIGMNLYDGSALMAFQMRDKAGAALWDGGAFRHPASADGKAYIFSRKETIFQPMRSWKSPLTQASYPIEWLLRTPADNYVVRALLENQELDSRGSTGAVYWEGLCELLDGNRRQVGRGYLEMTGYAKPLVL